MNKKELNEALTQNNQAELQAQDAIKNSRLKGEPLKKALEQLESMKQYADASAKEAYKKAQHGK